MNEYVEPPELLKKLTITVDEEVYRGLHVRIGRRRISRFLNDLAKPHVSDAAKPWPTREELRAGYAAQAADEAGEAEALDWIETMVGDVAEEP